MNPELAAKSCCSFCKTEKAKREQKKEIPVCKSNRCKCERKKPTTRLLGRPINMGGDISIKAAEAHPVTKWDLKEEPEVATKDVPSPVPSL